MNRIAARRNPRSPILAALVAAAAGFAAPTVLAQAAAPPACTTEGLDWNNHPLFRASLHPSERDRPIRSLPCKVEATRELQSGGVTIGLTLSTLHHDQIDGPKRSVKLVEVTEIDAGVARSVGRLFLDRDPLDGEMIFAPQIRTIGDSVYIRLSPRHRQLYRLEGGRLFVSSAFAWRDALDDAFPADARSGDNLGIDLETMEGSVAIRSIASEPGRPSASAYGEHRVLVAKLIANDGRLHAEATRILPRRQGAEPFLDRINEMDEIVRAGLRNLPQGVEPCSFGAWSNDTDPAGLNVRAAPNPQSKVLGIVPPARIMPKQEEAFGPGPVKSEFRVIGHRDGWFLIENISPPGAAYAVPYPRHLPQPFKGRGWVNGRMIGGALAHGGLPEGRLYSSPHADSASTETLDSSGNHIGADTPIRHIHACSGWWALIETDEGKRGWWRSVCSNQVTNCS